MELQDDMHTELKDLLNNPQKVHAGHADLLRGAISSYPYFQPLYVLMAMAEKDQTALTQVAGHSRTMARATLFTHGHLVYTALHHPEELHFKRFAFGVPADQPEAESDEQITADPADGLDTSGLLDAEIGGLETLPLVPVSGPVLNLEEAGAEETLLPETPVEATEDEVYEEIGELETLPVLPVSGPVLSLEEPEAGEFTLPESTSEDAEDEVYEEIGELQALPVVPAAVVAPEIENLRPDEVPDNPLAEKEAARRAATDQPGTDGSQNEQVPAFPVPEPVAAFDFFAFDARFPATPAAETPAQTPHDAEDGRVSKYHDDALPYTFLWWLAKTRKEYESFRPYANPVQRTGATPETGLQQQYVEHIFHIQTPFEAEDLVAGSELPPRHGKEAELIDKFIRQQPQINAPEPEKIDTENKAKKSAEDQYDLVTETLAKIYIEQMLYHKAIDTYKKLSLKYPEKSRYFADLIQSIEKKI